MTTKPQLEDIHKALLRAFADKLRDRDCPAAIYKEAREFLKDNNFSADLSGYKDPTEFLDEDVSDVLPFPPQAS